MQLLAPIGRPKAAYATNRPPTSAYSIQTAYADTPIRRGRRFAAIRPLDIHTHVRRALIFSIYFTGAVDFDLPTDSKRDTPLTPIYTDTPLMPICAELRRNAADADLCRYVACAAIHSRPVY